MQETTRTRPQSVYNDGNQGEQPAGAAIRLRSAMIVAARRDGGALRLHAKCRGEQHLDDQDKLAERWLPRSAAPGRGLPLASVPAPRANTPVRLGCRRPKSFGPRGRLLAAGRRAC